jgi:serine protease Do
MRIFRFCLPIFLTLVSVAAAQDATQPAPNSAASEFYDKMRPALVAVKYQWANELSKQEIVGCGVVVREDGLVMIPMALASPYFPDEQMKNFKIVVPSDVNDPEEVDATFLGRDERADMAFVQAKGDRKWTAVHFENQPLAVGETVYGIGVLPKMAGYKGFLTQGIISALLRGEQPQGLVSGGMSNVGSPVFDDHFRAVGIVIPQDGQELLLDGRGELNAIISPPRFFVLSKYFADCIADPPSVDHPLQIPWMGVPEMQGVNKQFSDYLGLKDKPAVQIGDVVPGTPAAKGGLEAGSIIVAMNDKPLERGDLPEELPMILRRKLMRMKVGDTVNFTVLPDKGAATKQITVTLEQRPRESSQAKRFYAQDLGFVAREAVFTDTYTHKMKPDATGVVADLIRRDGAAGTAKLARDDWLLQLNGKVVTDLDEFKQDYQAFRRDHPHDAVVLVVHRSGGQEETVNIEPPQTDAAPGAGGAGGA